MKKLNKVISSILAASMVISCCAMSVFAESKAHVATITADKTSGVNVGDVVTIEVSIDSTENIKSCGYRLTFQPEGFDIDRTKGWESEEDYDMHENFIDQAWYDEMKVNVWGKRLSTFKYGYDDPTVGCITLGWTGDAVPASKVTSNYVIGKFYFEAKAEGTYTFAIDADNSSTADTGENVGASLTATPVTVTVGNPAPPKEDAAVAAPSNIAYSDKYLDGEVERVNAAFETEVTFEENSNPVKGIKVTGPAGSADVTLNTVIKSAGSVKVYINVLGVPFGKDITGITLAPINE